MKRILLTSTALIALGGAAFAESHESAGVSFSGSATLGYNDDTANAGQVALGADDDNQGFYWDANVAVTMTAMLNGGVTATATFDFDVADGNNGQALSAGGFLLSLTSDAASLYLGDTAFAAETYWASAGDMEGDGFSEADGEVVLRGEVVYGGVTAGLSYVLADSDGDITPDDVDQLSFGAKASFGAFNLSAAYQEESTAAGAYDPATGNGDFNTDEVFGVSAGGSFAGADVTVAYAEETNSGQSSIGAKVAYPFGPVTVTAYYVMEDITGGYANSDLEANYGLKAAYSNGPISVTADYQDDQGITKIALDGSYDVGNGLTALAGYYSEEAAAANGDDASTYYVAGEYDLGGGASVLVSYGVDDDQIQDDEIGANDYQRGTTIEVSFAF